MRHIAHVGQRSRNARRLDAAARAALLALLDEPLAARRGAYRRKSELTKPGAETFSRGAVAQLERRGLASACRRRGPFGSRLVSIDDAGRYYAATLLADLADAKVAAIVAAAAAAPIKQTNNEAGA